MRTDRERLRGVRVVIVEDDFLVVRSLAQQLATFGLEVAATVPSVAAATAVVERTPVDAAILDVHLRGETVEAFAEHLHRRGVPIVYLTGYADLDLLPAHLRVHPHVQKPVDPDQLLEAIAAALSGGGAAG